VSAHPNGGPRPGARERGVLAVAAVLLAIVVAAAVLDYRGVLSDVAAVPPACVPPDAPLCNQQRNDLLERRLDDANRLEAALALRAGLYALAVVAIVAGAFALVLRRRGRAGGAAAFRTLGVAGVLAFVAGNLVLASAPDGPVGLPTKAILAPSVAMLVAAAVGGLLFRFGLSPADGPARAPLLGSPLMWTGMGVAAATVVPAVLAVGGRGDCEQPRPEWIDAVLTVGLVTAGIGVVLGLVLLVRARWVSALFCVSFGPWVLAWGAVLSACLS
jgi:hypothetical protein